MLELILVCNFEFKFFVNFNHTKPHLFLEEYGKKLLWWLSQYYWGLLKQKLFFMSAKRCMTRFKILRSVLLEKSWILWKNDTILRENIGKCRIFHNFLSFRRSTDDMGDILWRNYFITVTFLNFVLFQFKALFFMPIKTP